MAFRKTFLEDLARRQREEQARKEAVQPVSVEVVEAIPLTIGTAAGGLSKLTGKAIGAVGVSAIEARIVLANRMGGSSTAHTWDAVAHDNELLLLAA